MQIAAENRIDITTQNPPLATAYRFESGHRHQQHPQTHWDLRRRASALFFERAKENPDIKIVVVWPGQYRSEAFLCDPTVALEKIR